MGGRSIPPGGGPRSSRGPLPLPYSQRGGSPPTEREQEDELNWTLPTAGMPPEQTRTRGGSTASPGAQGIGNLQTPKRYLGLGAKDWWNHRRLPGLASPGSSDDESSEDGSSAPSVRSIGAEVRRSWQEALDSSSQQQRGVGMSQPLREPEPEPTPPPKWTLTSAASLSAALRAAVQETKEHSDCIHAAGWPNSLRLIKGENVGPLRKRRPLQTPSRQSSRWTSSRGSFRPHGAGMRSDSLMRVAGIPRASSATSTPSASSSLMEAFWGADLYHAGRQEQFHPRVFQGAQPVVSQLFREQPRPKPNMDVGGGGGGGVVPRRVRKVNVTTDTEVDRPGLSRQSKTLLERRSERPRAGSFTAGALMSLGHAPGAAAAPPRTSGRRSKPVSQTASVPRAHRSPLRSPPAPAVSSPVETPRDELAFDTVHQTAWGYLLLKSGHEVEEGRCLGKVLVTEGEPPRAQTADLPHQRLHQTPIRHRRAHRTQEDSRHLSWTHPLRPRDVR
eukprot:Hpha_TRINITY_DN15711_c1_g6::TRINITY_DN15711_c1_g6_i1::g.39082::m.39082